MAELRLITIYFTLTKIVAMKYEISLNGGAKGSEIVAAIAEASEENPMLSYSLVPAALRFSYRNGLPDQGSEHPYAEQSNTGHSNDGQAHTEQGDCLNIQWKRRMNIGIIPYIKSVIIRSEEAIYGNDTYQRLTFYPIFNELEKEELELIGSELADRVGRLGTTP